MAADVVISYAREDRSHCDQIASLLTKCGFAVWYDRSSAAGTRYRNEIRSQITQAGAVLVLWSPHAVESEWVPEECTIALKPDKLVQVVLSKCDLPLPFSGRTFARLPEVWDTSEEWYGVVSRIFSLSRHALITERDDLQRRVAEARVIQQHNENMTRKAIERNGHLKALNEAERVRSRRARELWREQGTATKEVRAEAEALRVELKVASAQCENLTNEAIGLMARSEEIERQLKEKLQTASDTQREISEYNIQYAKLVQSSEVERKQLESTNTALADANSSLTAQVEGLNAEIKVMQDDLDELRGRAARMDEVERDRDALARNLDILKLDLAAADRVQTTLQEQLLELERARLRWPWNGNQRKPTGR